MAGDSTMCLFCAKYFTGFLDYGNLMCVLLETMGYVLYYDVGECLKIYLEPYVMMGVGCVTCALCVW